ncbi:hypothetical protein C4D60_Mb10t19200 [Musa balbisiana]|uniref:Uncharacterized protein n=1 Tax=Musa balbisiana TaxID=52838 RepID=A0A4S8IYC0_MUSBA|nr:hypothetical protein C4D60_Mb10t19200 [Musa balbisiana]
MIVTRLAWMAQRLVSSKRPTRYASAASCSAATAELWKRRSVLKSWAISRTRRWNGSFRMSSSVLFWYLRISRRATVPGRKRCGFFTPPVAGADFRAAFVASCFRRLPRRFASCFRGPSRRWTSGPSASYAPSPRALNQELAKTSCSDDGMRIEMGWGRRSGMAGI